MKVFSILILTLASFSAFAGPEDHIADQTCYFLEASSPAPTSYVIPLKVCLEKISVNLPEQKVSVYSYFSPEFYTNLKLDYLARHNENGFSFRASSVINQTSNGSCDAASTTVLNIAGRTDNDGAVAPTDLTISVDHLSTSDICHSAAEKTTYNYAK